MGSSSRQEEVVEEAMLHHHHPVPTGSLQVEAMDRARTPHPAVAMDRVQVHALLFSFNEMSIHVPEAVI